MSAVNFKLKPQCGAVGRCRRARSAESRGRPRGAEAGVPWRVSPCAFQWQPACLVRLPVILQAGPPRPARAGCTLLVLHSQVDSELASPSSLRPLRPRGSARLQVVNFARNVTGTVRGGDDVGGPISVTEREPYFLPLCTPPATVTVRIRPGLDWRLRVSGVARTSKFCSVAFTVFEDRTGSGGLPGASSHPCARAAPPALRRPRPAA
jgi:hypothetical protein